MRLECTIPGAPVPQKQTRFARGRAYDPSSKDKERIRKQLWLHAPPEVLDCAVNVAIFLHFEIPKCYTKRQIESIDRENYVHTKKPDADNCAYIITNAMKGIWIVDDSQIASLYIFKRYASNGMSKTVVRLWSHERVG